MSIVVRFGGMDGKQLTKKKDQVTLDGGYIVKINN
jgi:hypothetical protein